MLLADHENGYESDVESGFAFGASLLALEFGAAVAALVAARR